MKRSLPNATLEKAMREYRAVIRSMLDTDSRDIMENASLSHAAVILEEMVRHAKTSFYAVAQTLNEKAWNSEVVQALAEAKRRGVDIELLVTTSDNASLAHLDGWDASIRGCIKKISGQVRESVRTLENFAVTDRKAFRFEMDKERASAVFCANDPEFAASMLNYFRRLKSGALPLAEMA